MKDISHHLEIFGLYCAMVAIGATGLLVHIGNAVGFGWLGLPVAAAAAVVGTVVVHKAAGWYAHRHQLDGEEVADR